MGYFAVWVKTGKEIAVQQELLSRNLPQLTSVFAMDRFTAAVPSAHLSSSASFFEIDVGDYLHKEHIRETLQQLRQTSLHFADTELDTREMMQSYRRTLHALTEDLEKARMGTEMPYLPGYILIDINTEQDELDAVLWHQIKEIPDVIGFPSQYALPEDEVLAMFVTLAPSPVFPVSKIITWLSTSLVPSSIRFFDQVMERLARLRLLHLYIRKRRITC